ALLTFGGEKRAGLMAIRSRLRLALVTNRIDTSQRVLAEFDRRLCRIVENRIKADGLRLTGQGKLLESLSFEQVLDRGFAIVRKQNGTVVMATAGAAPGDALAITFRDGVVAVTVDGADATAKQKPRAKRKSRSFTKGKAKNGGQGSLF
ncbi:MAG: exodeoxyribonuclease VII large subunit, partial [Alphaproteobacteria bacterium]